MANNYWVLGTFTRAPHELSYLLVATILILYTSKFSLGEISQLFIKDLKHEPKTIWRFTPDLSP